MKIRTVSVFVFIISSILIRSNVIADEGMWMPHQMKMLNLEALGLKMNPDDLFKADGTGLMSAVVDLGGGTGSFVSPNGLILTNHHVAFGALQRASDPEHNYIRDGFLANNFSQEIQAPGYTAGVLLNYYDVTAQINAKLKKNMSPREKYKAIDMAKKLLLEKAESKGKDRYAEIASMYSGNQYFLFEYKQIKDIRIVYAPPRDIGNFGGETDNWMWPRHTCDFTFLRAYVSPEGIGSDFSQDNIPYNPKIHFKIAHPGVKDGDFTFIMGYPGKTYRNFSTPELVFDIDKLKKGIEDRLQYIAFFETVSKKSTSIEIKYASKLKGLYNGLKNYRGKLEGFEKTGVIGVKKKNDEEFRLWVKEDKNRSKLYGDIIDKIAAFYENEYKRFFDQENELNNLTYYRRGVEILTVAHNLVRISLEKQKPDMQREDRYQERSLPKLINRMNLAERRSDLETERDYTILRLNKLAALPTDLQPEIIQSIITSHGGITEWAHSTFKNTKITDLNYRLKLIDKTPAELKSLNDPLIEFAFQLENELSVLRDKKHIISQKLEDLKKVYIKGLLEMRKQFMAPDANSTIRFTSGHIKGYAPKDAVFYTPLTTLGGVIDKDTGEFPFHVPEKLKTLYKQKEFGSYAVEELGDVPACFLNTTNVTGGNSGSPTINARGEIAGLVFDMTYESVIGDYYIIPQLQRVISADIRYVLFITDKFSGANHLIKEMGL